MAILQQLKILLEHAYGGLINWFPRSLFEHVLIVGIGLHNRRSWVLRSIVAENVARLLM